jgi:hypothetical protein
MTSADDSAAQGGPCRKAANAVYVGYSREDILLAALFVRCGRSAAPSGDGGAADPVSQREHVRLGRDPPADDRVGGPLVPRVLRVDFRLTY